MIFIDPSQLKHEPERLPVAPGETVVEYDPLLVEGCEETDVVALVYYGSVGPENTGDDDIRIRVRLVRIERALRPDEMRVEYDTVMGLLGLRDGMCSIPKHHTIQDTDYGIELPELGVRIEPEIDALHGIRYQVLVPTPEGDESEGSFRLFSGAVRKVFELEMREFLNRCLDHYVEPHERCGTCGHATHRNSRGRRVCDCCEFRAEEQRMIEEGDEWNPPRKLG